MKLKKLIVPVLAFAILFTACSFSDSTSENSTRDIYVEDTTNATASYSITADKELVKGNTVKLAVSSKDFGTFEAGKNVIAMQFSVQFSGMKLVEYNDDQVELPKGWNISATEMETANADGRSIYMLDSDFKNPIADQTVAVLTFDVTDDNPSVYLDGIKIVCQLTSYQEFTCAYYDFDAVKDAVTIGTIDDTASKIDDTSK